MFNGAFHGLVTLYQSSSVPWTTEAPVAPCGHCGPCGPVAHCCHPPRDTLVVT